MILSIIFFPNPISIAIALIGANLSDFDHDIKKINLYKMLIIGLLVFIVLFMINLYLIKVPYIIGVILCILPIIFYFSNHRGFTHSLLGIVVLSILMFLTMLMGIEMISQIIISLNLSIISFSFIFSSQIIAMIIVVIFFAVLTINKKLIIPFIILFLLGIIFFPNGVEVINFLGNGFIFESGFNLTQFSLIDTNFSYNSALIGGNISNSLPYTDFLGYNPFEISVEMIQMLKYIFLPLFLGLLSHLILDSLTPSGIELFRPFSSKKVYKKFAIFSLAILSFLVILKYFSNFFFF